MKQSIDQLCDEEIPPVVIDAKPDHYKPKQNSVGKTVCYSFANGLIFSNLPYLVEGLANIDYKTIGLSLVSFGMAAGLITIGKKCKVRNIDSLVKDYTKYQEELK